MRTAGNWRVGQGGCDPAVCRRIIAPAGLDPGRIKAASAPDNHLCPGPDRGVTTSCLRRSGGGCGRPSVVSWIITTAGLENGGPRAAAPDNHLCSSPHRRMQVSGSWRSRLGGWLPTVGGGAITRASIGLSDKAIVSAPDNHFRAGPDRSQEFSRGSSLTRVSRCPAICRWVITAPSKGITIH
jgi:hypothetical protein